MDPKKRNRMMSPYYDRQGNSIDMRTWADKVEDLNYKIVKQETIGKYFVSTVWIGLDMNLLGRTKLIFETMIFGDEIDENDRLDSYQERYETEEEAIAGHQKTVEMVKVRVNKE